MVVLRQKHQQPPGNADLCGQARAFATQGVFDDLHHQRLALEHLFFNGHQGFAFAGEHGRFAVFLALPDIGHMQKGSALQANVNEGRLHAWQHA